MNNQATDLSFIQWVLGIPFSYSLAYKVPSASPHLHPTPSLFLKIRSLR